MGITMRPQLRVWSHRAPLLAIAVLVACFATTLSRISLGAASPASWASKAARAGLNVASLTSGYTVLAVMQLYALGIPRPGTGHLRLPPFPRKSLYTIAAVIALIGVSEAVDRRDLYDPAVSTLLFRIYYVAHILLLLVCYLVLVPAATGAFDSALVSLGLRPALPHRIAAATGAAEARGTQEGRACTPLRRRCWWPRHPAVVCGVTFLLATVAVQLQAFGQPQVATLLMPASLLGWAVSASPLTRGVGHPHTRRRALAVFLSITAAAAGRLFRVARDLGDNSLAKVGMSAVYAATMAVLVRIWHWTARQVFAAEPIASALLPQMIAAVFGELFFLVFVPFSPAFFAALTLNVTKGFTLGLDLPWLASRWLRRLSAPRFAQWLQAPPGGQKGVAPSRRAAPNAAVLAAAYRASARTRWVDQALVGEAVAALTAPVTILVELGWNAAGFGTPSLTRGLSDSSRVALLKGYALITFAQLTMCVVVTKFQHRRLQRIHRLLVAINSHAGHRAATGSRRGRRGGFGAGIRLLWSRAARAAPVAPRAKRVAEAARGKEPRSAALEACPEAAMGTSDSEPPSPHVATLQTLGPLSPGAEHDEDTEVKEACTPKAVAIQRPPTFAGRATSGRPGSAPFTGEASAWPKGTDRSHLSRRWGWASFHANPKDVERSSVGYWERHWWLFLAVTVHTVCSSIIEVGVINYIQGGEF